MSAASVVPTRDANTKVVAWGLSRSATTKLQTADSNSLK